MAAGLEEKEGAVCIAFANTFLLAPISSLGADPALCADFHDIIVVEE